MDFNLMIDSLPKLLNATLTTLKLLSLSIIFGLIGGLLFFPSPNFTQSFLVGFIAPAKYFPTFINESLLFISFLVATILPVLVIKVKKIF